MVSYLQKSLLRAFSWKASWTFSYRKVQIASLSEEKKWGNCVISLHRGAAVLPVFLCGRRRGPVSILRLLASADLTLQSDSNLRSTVYRLWNVSTCAAETRQQLLQFAKRKKMWSAKDISWLMWWSVFNSQDWLSSRTKYMQSVSLSFFFIYIYIYYCFLCFQVL